MKTVRPLIPALLFGVLAATQALSSARAQNHAREALDWIATLGFRDVADKPFVRVATGRWSRSGREPAHNTYLHGFLLDDRGQTFTVLDLSDRVHHFERSAAGTAPHAVVAYEVTDLKDVARRVARGLGPRAEPVLGELQFAGVESWGEVSCAVRLAQACGQQGLAEVAQQLAEAAARVSLEQRGLPLRSFLERDIGKAEVLRVLLAFEDPEVSFEALDVRLRRVVERFPESEYSARAAAMSEVLQAMSRTAPLDPDSTRSERLVRELRTQNGRQFGLPGSCDPFADPRGDASPAHQLAALGFEAVPALLAAVDDPSFTRSLQLAELAYPHHVLCVGEVARLVLGKIAGRSFDDAASAQRWWSQVRELGEVAVLDEGVRWGSQASVSMVRRLLALDRAAALDALLAGCRAASDGWVRRQLIAELRAFDDAVAQAYLHGVMAGDAELRVRMAAAMSLYSKEPEAVTARLIRWWGTGPEVLADEGRPMVMELEALGIALARMGRADTVAALAQRPDVLVPDIVRALVRRDPYVTAEHYIVEFAPPADRAHVEALLLRCLQIERRFGGNYGGVPDPRLCDFAAMALAAGWPDKYSFAFDENIVGRRKAIEVMRGAEVQYEYDTGPRSRLGGVDFVGPGAGALRAALGQQVQAWVGEELQPGALAALVAGFGRAPAPGMRSLDLLVVHGADKGDGLWLEVGGLVAPQGFAPGNSAGLRQFVVCGDRGLLGSTGGGQRTAYLDPRTYAEWVDKLYDALEMDGGLEARLHLILR